MKDGILTRLQAWINLIIRYASALALFIGLGILFVTLFIDKIRGTSSDFGARQIALLIMGLVISVGSAAILIQVNFPTLWGKIRPNTWMIAIVAIYAFLQVFFGERIQVGNGYGWDGISYAKLILEFPRIFTHHELSSYSIQRVLPSLLVYAGMRLVHVPITSLGIIYSFRVFNGLLLVLCAYLWGKIADRLEMGSRSRWLGFILLFGNFAILKYWSYYPVLTDQSAFTLGMLMVFFFLKKSRLGLVMVTLLAAFTWPGLLFFLFFFLAFPGSAPLDDLTEPAPYHVNWLVGGAAASAVLLILANSIFQTGNYLQGWTDNMVNLFGTGYRFGYEPALALAIFITCAATLVGISLMLNKLKLFELNTYIRSFNLTGLLIWILIYAGASLIARYTGNHEGQNSIMTILSRQLLIGQAYPGLAFVAHAVYFGPVVILALLWFPRIIKSAHRLGMSLVLASTLAILMSIMFPESRALIMLLPLFCLLVVLASEEVLRHDWQYWLIACTSLVASKAWLALNSGDPILNFISPNFGPWMGLEMYSLQLLLIIILAVVFFAAFRPEA